MDAPARESCSTASPSEPTRTRNARRCIVGSLRIGVAETSSAAVKLVGIPRRARAVISSTSLPAMSVNRVPLAFNANTVAVKSSYRGSVTMYRRGPIVWTTLTRGSDKAGSGVSATRA